MTDRTVNLTYFAGRGGSWRLSVGADRIATFRDGPVQRRLAYITAERAAKIFMEDDIEIVGPEVQVERMKLMNGLMAMSEAAA